MVLPASDCAFEPLLQFLGTGLLPCVDGKRKGSESCPGGSRGTFWESTEVATLRVFQPWMPAALIGGPSPGIQGAPCSQHPRPSLPTPQVLGSAIFFLVKRTLSPVPAAAGRSLRRSSEEPQDWSRRAARQREQRLPGLRGRGPGRGGA